MSYVCTKALRISGVDYAPGDAIPDGAIRPERVRALKTSGFIGELTEEVAPPADKKPEEKVVIEQVTIPVKAEDGREMEVSLSVRLRRERRSTVRPPGFISQYAVLMACPSAYSVAARAVLRRL